MGGSRVIRVLIGGIVEPAVFWRQTIAAPRSHSHPIRFISQSASRRSLSSPTLPYHTYTLVQPIIAVCWTVRICPLEKTASDYRSIRAYALAILSSVRSLTPLHRYRFCDIFCLTYIPPCTTGPLPEIPKDFRPFDLSAFQTFAHLRISKRMSLHHAGHDATPRSKTRAVAGLNHERMVWRQQLQSITAE